MTFKRPHKRVAELERRIIELTHSRDAWRMYALKLDPKLAAICGEPPAAPRGYEQFTPATIAAIAGTCQTQADRAGQSQDEVFAKLAALGSGKVDAQGNPWPRTVAEEPAPARDDNQ
jgi:hypothetical protein